MSLLVCGFAGSSMSLLNPVPVGNPDPPFAGSPHDTRLPSAGRYAVNAYAVERTSLLKPVPVGNPDPPYLASPHDTRLPSDVRTAAKEFLFGNC